MFSHLREASLCEWRGFSITLGYFINRTAGARLPDPLPPPAACVCARVSGCVCVCVREHVETKWQTTTRALGKLGACWTLVNQKPPAAASAGDFPEETLKSCLSAAGYWRQKGRAFPLILSLKWKKKGPFGLTAPFILYYPVWLLTPGELCSQIDALLLWGCSWNIKLYWNIHMWVHLAESNWCATPQTPNGNVAGPRHALADTLSSGQDRHWDAAKASKSDLSGRLPDSGRLMSVSAQRPESIWHCAAN